MLSAWKAADVQRCCSATDTPALLGFKDPSMHVSACLGLAVRGHICVHTAVRTPYEKSSRLQRGVTSVRGVLALLVFDAVSTQYCTCNGFVL